MILWKRITLGELGVIITMVVSLFLFLVKVGEWKSSIELSTAQSIRATNQLRHDVRDLNKKVDVVSSQEEEYMNTLNGRLIRVETKISKGLGLPPYGPSNPPPIIKYRDKEEDQ